MVRARDILDSIAMLEKTYWVKKVKTKWHPPAGLFTKDPKTIASVLAKASKSLKQAMARLNFYINRSGYCNPKSSHYDKAACSRLQKVKPLLRAAFATESYDGSDVPDDFYDEEILDMELEGDEGGED